MSNGLGGLTEGLGKATAVLGEVDALMEKTQSDLTLLQDLIGMGGGLLKKGGGLVAGAGTDFFQGMGQEELGAKLFGYCTFKDDYGEIWTVEMLVAKISEFAEENADLEMKLAQKEAILKDMKIKDANWLALFADLLAQLKKCKEDYKGLLGRKNDAMKIIREKTNCPPPVECPPPCEQPIFKKSTKSTSTSTTTRVPSFSLASGEKSTPSR